MNYEKMTIEELESKNQELSRQRDLIHQEQLKIVKVIDQKISEREGMRKSGVTPEKEAKKSGFLKRFKP